MTDDSSQPEPSGAQHAEDLPTKPHGDPLLNEVKPGGDHDVPDVGKGTATSAEA